jgi:hypothetical protein
MCGVPKGHVALLRPDRFAPKRCQPNASIVTGLAAACVSKPTVAQYTRYFRYLQIGFLATGSGSYGEAPRHHVMAVYRTFPEKSIPMGENMTRTFLKKGSGQFDVKIYAKP